MPDRKELNDGYIKYIADQLHIEVGRLDDLLGNWSPEDLQKHLESQPPEKLRQQVFGIKK